MQSTRHCFRLLLATRSAMRYRRSAAVWRSVYAPNSNKDDETLRSSLFKPVHVQPIKVGDDIGSELVGKLEKSAIINILNQFTQRSIILRLCEENGLDKYLQQQAFASFRRFCIETEIIPAELHICLHNIIQGNGHVDDIFPYFLRHTKEVFPHLVCIEDLKKISDLREPANWYPNARAIKRKIIFHAGPTNSGKTYHAMERFINASSGVYCGPLKLLATEVYNKVNEKNVPCDLVTGEERKYGLNESTPANHVACTVEMTSVNTPYDVAVIDEIQQLRDPQRGWAWTRAFLGLIAKEVHVCGEAGALELLQNICVTTNETIEMRTYDRLTELTIEDTALTSLDNVMPGDCIVCFSKKDIYTVSREIEARGKEVAVIYGGLPPGTKLVQAAKFNDPKNSCKVLVATDAIGMGLNLSIRRIIFYSLTKPSQTTSGEILVDYISVSSALQIAGRAGRYKTQWEHGYVTTFRPADLPVLQNILKQTPEPLTQAGLHPTADQIELYAYHLPKSSLSNLMDIFVNLCTVDDSLYFMCNIDDFKYLANMIEHISLPLRARYVFCCAPINKKMPFVCSMFQKIARQYSLNAPVTFDLISKHCGWPPQPPKTILDLMRLEAVFDVMDLYLWLSYRFLDQFPDSATVRLAQTQLDEIIQEGVFQITRLLKNTEAGQNSAQSGETSHKTPSSANESKASDATSLLRGRLTERLLAQGLLTNEMLKQLQREWNKEQKKLSSEVSSRQEQENVNNESAAFHTGNYRNARRKRRK